MPSPDQSRRTADALVQKSEQNLGSVSLIANKQVALWKAGLIALFAAGVFSALAFIGGTNYSSSTQAAGLEMPAPDARRAKVVIERMDPSEGLVGTNVTLFGKDFSRKENIVHFGTGVIMDVPSAPDPKNKNKRIISFAVPEHLTPRCAYQRRPCLAPSIPVTAGTYQVWIQNERDQKSQAVTFTVKAKLPLIQGVAPSSGLVGAKVAITGSGFTQGNNYVKFFWNDTSIVCVQEPCYRERTGYLPTPSLDGNTIAFFIPDYVSPCLPPLFPSEAPPPVCIQSIHPILPGGHLLSVVNQNGESNSVKFEVLPKELPRPLVRIDSITPEKGPVGTKVGIVGLGFLPARPDGLPVHNYVKFTRPDSSLLGYAGGLAEGETRITFTLPSEVERSICITDPCPIVEPQVYPAPVTPGAYLLSVVNQNGESNPVKFEVTGGQTVAVKLERMNPATGSVGTKVVLAGQGFTKTGNMIHFGGGSIGYVDSADGKSMVFTVPFELGSACDYYTPPCPGPAPMQVMPGEYRIMISNQNGISNQLIFTVTGTDTKAPVLQGVNPTSGKVGDKIVLTGSGFARRLPDGPASVNYIKFTPTDAKFTPTDATKAGYLEAYSDNGATITFTVPEYVNPCHPSFPSGPQVDCMLAFLYPVTPGAYLLSVVNQNGESNPVKFEVTGGLTAAVKIERIAPASGPVGTEIVLGGQGFTPTGNTVYFGGGVIPNLPAELGSQGGVIKLKVPNYLQPPCLFENPPCLISPPAPGYQLPSGPYTVKVSNVNGISNPVIFEVTGGDNPVSPDLKMSKTVTDADEVNVTANSNAPGSAQTYTITVANAGNGSVSGVILSDNYDETNFTITKNGGGSDNGGTITWNLGSIPPGTSVVKNIEGMIKPSLPSLISVNVARVDASNAASTTAMVLTSVKSMTVALERMTPVMGPIGTKVGLGGNGFAPTGNTVHFGSGVIKDLKAETGASGGVIYFTVPAYLTIMPPECDAYASPLPCPLKPAVMVPVQPGEYPVSVSNANGESNEMVFTVVVY